MSDDYSAICGITEQELLSQMQPDIERIAQANDETYEEACRHLKRQYDGYHFSKNCEDIYNPFSLFNAFSQKDYKSFWFSTGTSTLLIEMLQRMDLNAIGRTDVVIKMPDAIYVFEFKIDGTPEEALAQINSKQYAIPYEIDHRKVVKVGVNFDSITRTLGEWVIEYS
ncbi:hypothetical protein BFINE_34890 [Bacteroides finegoldii DSM 17565]|jgi:hypothetical protein|nr:hypothetical protein BACFIN_07592 [Bacteroides finegoldii DSM 17565]BDW77694.1 hypothetical protein BFINE_34890 [Bacteroides finegoldii DSM 17565]